jgi:hypothetical protein
MDQAMCTISRGRYKNCGLEDVKGDFGKLPCSMSSLANILGMLASP